MIEAVAIISGRYLARNINLGGDPLRHLFQSLCISPSVCFWEAVINDN
jgi:hypothetical protein